MALSRVGNDGSARRWPLSSKDRCTVRIIPRRVAIRSLREMSFSSDGLGGGRRRIACCCYLLLALVLVPFFNMAVAVDCSSSCIIMKDHESCELGVND